MYDTLDIVSNFSMHRNIGFSMYRIERTCFPPSIPWPPPCFSSMQIMNGSFKSIRYRYRIDLFSSYKLVSYRVDSLFLFIGIVSCRFSFLVIGVVSCRFAFSVVGIVSCRLVFVLGLSVSYRLTLLPTGIAYICMYIFAPPLYYLRPSSFSPSNS